MVVTRRDQLICSATSLADSAPVTKELTVFPVTLARFVIVMPSKEVFEVFTIAHALQFTHALQPSYAVPLPQDGYYSLTDGCLPCSCDTRNTLFGDIKCDAYGQCLCKPGQTYTDPYKCATCPAGTYQNNGFCSRE